MKLSYLLTILTTIDSAFAAPANNNTSPQAPQAGIYFNAASGKYVGTTTTVNGGTNYYRDGKYQGQSPANNKSFYLNKDGKLQQINK